LNYWTEFRANSGYDHHRKNKKFSKLLTFGPKFRTLGAHVATESLRKLLELCVLQVAALLWFPEICFGNNPLRVTSETIPQGTHHVKLCMEIINGALGLQLLEVGRNQICLFRLAGGWWPVLVCSERRVLLAGSGWLLVAGLFWEKSTVGWWLISQAICHDLVWLWPHSKSNSLSSSSFISLAIQSDPLGIFG
jgi:hypothetical protein